MKKTTLILLIGSVVLFGCYAKNGDTKPLNKAIENATPPLNAANMKLGAFSVSLNVKDLAASKLFYENLGFTVLGGGMKMKYLIMKNGNSLIGLFEGMFEKNILTFNPGWDENGKNVEPFDDIKEIQKRLKEKGIKLDTEIEPVDSVGPSSIMLKDPDGNVILIDQHR